ncbi:MAG: lipopolysaccharide export LptBFGC system permease protein LptF [Sulfurimonas sp.]|jgi:lipopolysaccharide export LptBFGC system permease protein LptF|uniref:hypothetical protein n=1 Tax=Sulfurimonas sp. TaxID=2022749 RepID=UPI0039E33EA4
MAKHIRRSGSKVLPILFIILEAVAFILMLHILQQAWRGDITPIHIFVFIWFLISPVKRFLGKISRLADPKKRHENTYQ